MLLKKFEASPVSVPRSPNLRGLPLFPYPNSRFGSYFVRTQPAGKGWEGLFREEAYICIIRGPDEALTSETFKPLLKNLIQNPENFTSDDAQLAFEHLLRPESTTPAQIGSFLTTLHPAAPQGHLEGRK